MFMELCEEEGVLGAGGWWMGLSCFRRALQRALKVLCKFLPLLKYASSWQHLLTQELESRADPDQTQPRAADCGCASLPSGQAWAQESEQCFCGQLCGFRWRNTQSSSDSNHRMFICPGCVHTYIMSVYKCVQSQDAVLSGRGLKD